jgi:multiple sugar transport system ATP-binding protein
MNFLAGKVASFGTDGVHVSLDANPASATAAPVPVRGDSAAAGLPVTLGIRPEHIALGQGGAGDISMTATIEQLEQLGAASFLYCSLPGGEPLTVHAAGQVPSRAGETVIVSFPATKAQLFRSGDEGTAFARVPAPAMRGIA